MSELYALVDAEKASFGKSLMCSLLGVSRSGYYEWKDRPASISARRRGRLADLIVAIFDASGRTYGYRRSTPSLPASAWPPTTSSSAG